MQLNKETNSAKYQITKYTANSITVNQQEFSGSIIVAPNSLTVWNMPNISALTRDALQLIIESRPEIILLGTGADLVFPDLAILQDVYKHKIGLEIMTTPAACRTYAALTSEGRNVVAALIL